MTPEQAPVNLLKPFMAALILPLLVAAQSNAASITNRDEREHKLTIVTGEAGDSRVLKPREAVSGLCPKGCVLRLNDDEIAAYELEGSDVVSIEDGFVYYDVSESKAAPVPSAPAPSPQAK